MLDELLKTKTRSQNLFITFQVFGLVLFRCGLRSNLVNYKIWGTKKLVFIQGNESEPWVSNIVLSYELIDYNGDAPWPIKGYLKPDLRLRFAKMDG